MDFPLLGRHNSLLKDIRRLDTPSARERSGLFLVEGIRVIGEVLKAKFPLKTLLVDSKAHGEALKLAYDAKNTGCEVLSVEADVLERIAPANTSQGLLALAYLPTYSLEDMLKGDFLLLLDGIGDPGNVGTLIRSALAFGVKGMILSGGADCFNSRAVRSSAGALFHLPVLRVGEGMLPEVLAEMEKRSFCLAAAVAHNGKDPENVKLTKPCALVMGAEVDGVSSSALVKIHHELTIPLAAESESLNVAVAGSVLLYQISRNLV